MKSLVSKLESEEGSFLSTMVFLAIVFALIAIFIIDGVSVFRAYSASGTVAEDAAHAAVLDYNQNRSDDHAQDVASQYCQDRGFTFVGFEVNPVGHSYKVTCSADAKTYFFRYIPGLKDQVHQQNSGTDSETG